MHTSFRAWLRCWQCRSQLIKDWTYPDIHDTPQLQTEAIASALIAQPDFRFATVPHSRQYLKQKRTFRAPKFSPADFEYVRLCPTQEFSPFNSGAGALLLSQIFQLLIVKIVVETSFTRWPFADARQPSLFRPPLRLSADDIHHSGATSLSCV